MKGSLAVAILFMLVTSCSRNRTTSHYPSGPVEVIVPFAPGGGSDTFARLIKEEIDAKGLMPYPLVIINAPGAGGSVGSRRVMNEEPDGSTVLLLHDGILTSKRSGKTLYGPEAFERVAGTGRSGTVIAVREDSAYSDLDSLLGAAAERPDHVTFAANLGAPSHFAGLMMEQSHGSAKFRFAQTGGGSDRFSALKGGHVDVTAFSLDEYVRFRVDGVKAIAFLGLQRHPQIPDVASAMEQGYDVQYSVMQYWWMPKGTSRERCNWFAGVLKRAMQSPTFQRKLAAMNIDPVYLGGEELAIHLARAETALRRVDPRSESPLPNLPAALGVLLLVLLVAV